MKDLEGAAKHIEQITLEFVEKAYPGIDTPVVTNIEVEERSFIKNTIAFNVWVSSIFGSSFPVVIRVKTEIQITCLEIPGAIREWGDNDHKAID